MGGRMTIDDLREHFDLLDSWEERYGYLIDLGRKLPPMQAELKNDQTKVEGCLSSVWLHARYEDGVLRFDADSDASIVRGLIAILMVAYDNKRPEDIVALDVSTLFDELGFHSQVSMNRRNGFFAMVGRIQTEARLALLGSSLASTPEST